MNVQKLKVGIWLPDFDTFEENKCYAQIALGLKELGVDVWLLTNGIGKYNGKDSVGVISGITENKAKEIFSTFDWLIMYGWLGKLYTKWIKIAGNSGAKVILKLDHDGRFGTRLSLLHQSQRLVLFTAYKSFKSFINAGKIVGKLFLCTLPQIRRKLFEHMKLQMEIANAVVIESPQAGHNLIAALGDINQLSLIKKVRIIPNPVAPYFSSIPDTQQLRKEKFVVSVGRWNDINQKNTFTLIKTLVKFLESKQDWRAVLIGPGEGLIKSYLESKSISDDVLRRLNIVGPIPNEEVNNIVRNSRIFFSASLWEGFPISAAEALCMGNTIVGPNIEAFQFFAGTGEFGTLAITHRWRDLFGALIYESEKWELGFRDPISTSKVWKSKLNRKKVAEDFLKIMTPYSR